jgi:hypothetical protein
MRGDAEPQNLPPAMSHDQQAVEKPERDCRNHEKVHRGNTVGMVAKERLPSLRRRADAGLADLEPSLRSRDRSNAIKHLAAKPLLTALNCINGLQAKSKTR